jgi:hypothetical protein
MPIIINAYVDGTISEVMDREGVVVETKGAFIQGILVSVENAKAF